MCDVHDKIKKMHYSRNKYIKALILTGVLTVFGAVIFQTNTKILDFILKRTLVLSPNSLIFNTWQNPDMDILIDVYFFNWTNPADFTNNKIKPKFTELGPYKFSETFKRVDVVFNKNGTISHRNRKYFDFNDKLSSGTLDDNITFLNVVTMSAVNLSKKWNFFFKKGLAIVLGSFPYEVTKSVREVLFEGYRDPFLDASKFLPFLEGLPKLEQFAWFYQRNGSAEYEGYYTIGTGTANTTFGMLYEWNHRGHGPYPGHCSSIRASSGGELFEQNLPKDKLTFFFPDFCRAVVLDYLETVTWNGIEGYKYIADRSFLDSGSNENSCLCQEACRKFGVIDYHSCRPELPGYLSLPHFFKADSSYRNEIDGMKPDPKKHDLYMIINPRTGLVLDIDMRIQINILARPNEDIRKYASVPEVMLPMLWFSVKLHLPDQQQRLLRCGLMLPTILEILSVLLILSGVSLSFFTIRCYIQNMKHENKSNYSIDDYINEEMKPLGNKNIGIN